MARKKKTRDNKSVLELLLDPLFGLIGALIVVFIMQVISMINMIDKDLIAVIEDSGQKIQRLEDKERECATIMTLNQDLSEELSQYKLKNLELARQYEQAEQKAVEQEALAAQYQHYEETLKARDDASETFIRQINDLQEKNSQLQKALGEQSPQAPVMLKTLKLPDAIQDKDYSLTLATEGGTPPFAFNRSGGPLPNGITLIPDQGLLAGKPSKTGSYEFAINVTDARGTNATKTFTLHVNAAGGVEGERSWKENLSTWVIMFVICLMVIALFRFSLGTFRNYKWKKAVEDNRKRGLEPLITLGPDNKPVVRWVPIGAFK